MSYDKIRLPVYTKTEDKANSISHIVGVAFGVAAMILLLIKSHDAAHIISSVIFGAAMIILYASSSVYHWLAPGNPKKFARLLDHAVIFVLITGTSIPLMILDVLPYCKWLAITCIAVSAVTAVVGIALTFVDQEKYNSLQMVLYMLLGWLCVFLFIPIYKNDTDWLRLLIMFLAGGAVYTLGTIFYAKGRFKKYYHFVFHLFILGGTVIHFLAFYNYLY